METWTGHELPQDHTARKCWGPDMASCAPKPRPLLRGVEEARDHIFLPTLSPARVRWADVVCVSFVPSSRSLSYLSTIRRGLWSPRGKQNHEMERGQVPESPSRGKPPINIRLSRVITKVLLCKTEIEGPVMAASTTLINIKMKASLALSYVYSYSFN